MGSRKSGEAVVFAEKMRFPMSRRVEQVAFSIWAHFVRHGAGSLKPIRNEDGSLAKDASGKPIPETIEQCLSRRWACLPEATRQSFMGEAVAAINAWEAAE